MKTLEMTWQGKALTRLTNATSYKLTAPLWNIAFTITCSNNDYSRKTKNIQEVFR